MSLSKYVFICQSKRPSLFFSNMTVTHFTPDEMKRNFVAYQNEI